MKKTNLFVDMDGTLIDSISACCEVYNHFFNRRSGFVEAKPENAFTWNMKEIFPLITDINILFGSEMFFEVAKPLDSDTLPVLRDLSKSYNLICCSIGVPDNVRLKPLFLQNNFPMITSAIWLQSDICKMDKSMVNMNSAIFLDDVFTNLHSSNANVKIVVGKEYEWNKDWTGTRCETWKQIGELLL